MRKSFFIVIDLNFRILLVFGIFLITLMILGFLNPGINAFGGDLKQSLIVIDPGHGGVDGGAVHGELMEKNINLDVSLKLQDQLRKEKVEVVMTRDKDVSLEEKSQVNASRYLMDLNGRKSIINNSNCDAFVSIHTDSQPHNLQKRGVTVFYYPESAKSKKLAEKISEHIDETIYEKFLKDSESKTVISSRNLYVLRETEVPGVLVEVGFLTNEEDRELLKDEKYLEKMALAIKNALSDYLKESNKELKDKTNKN